MGDEGARLIGSALSTASSTNKKLLALNLSFNSIGDEGATHIAQVLHLDRGSISFDALKAPWVLFFLVPLRVCG